MPYWRLSSFYFFYFAAVGALVPFWGLYLRGLGFTPLAIGELMAILMTTKIIAPNLWGWLADYTGERLPLVRSSSLLSLLAFSGLFAVQGFWGIALVMTLFSFFWHASLPQIEAVTFDHLGPWMHRYGSIRLWGSIGFILAVLALGIAVERIGTSIIPGSVLLCYAGIWLSSLVIPDPRRSPPEQPFSALSGLLKKPEIAAFLAACFLMQASHGAFYVFYSVYLTEAGYTGTLVGMLLAWGIIIEILVFWHMRRLLERFGARRGLLASLGLAGLRWLLTGGFVESPVIQLFAQTLHAATFGAFHAAAIYLVHRYFDGRTQGRNRGGQDKGEGASDPAPEHPAHQAADGDTGTEAQAAVEGLSAAPVAGLGWLVVWGWVDRERRF